MYIEFSAHNAFLVLTAPGMLIIKRLEKQIILKFLRAGKQKTYTEKPTYYFCLHCDSILDIIFFFS
jgi:hypothetical protein